MIVCGVLHEDDCPALLKTDWKYCPLCGRKTAAVKINSDTFTLTSLQESRITLQLRHEGFADIDGSVETADSALSLTSSPYFSLAPDRRVASIALTAGRIDKEQYALILLVTQNQRRDGGNADLVWRRQSELREPKRLRLIPTLPGRLEIQETLLLFSRATRERTLTLRNSGSTPLDVTLESLPVEYVLKEGSERRQIPPLGTITMLLGSVENRPAAGRREVILRCNGEDQTVSLLRLPERRSPLNPPRFVVGVDFGTRNTSVVIRDLRGDGTSLSLSFVSDVREPTCMYFSTVTRRVYFGDEAYAEQQNDGPARGVLVERLKEYLTGEKEPFFDSAKAYGFPNLENFKVNNLLALYMRDWKELIDADLDQRTQGSGAEVFYVFSVPVLDDTGAGDGPLYRLHTERMRKALRDAGFPADDPERFSFVKEPAAAALHFLIGKAFHPEVNARVAKMMKTQNAQLAQGIPLLIIDSGGGTTDVMLGNAMLDQAGKVRVNVVKFLGLDKEERRFGGVNITDDLYASLQKAWNIDATMQAAIGRKADPPEIKFRLLEPSKIYLSSENVGSLTPSNIQLILNSPRACADTLKKSLSSLLQQLRAGKNDFAISSQMLRDSFDAHWTPLEQAMREDVLEGQDLKKLYVLLVGGNTHLGTFWERCSSLFSPDRVIDLTHILDHKLPPLNKDDKMLAVVCGNAWYYDAEITNLTPYRLELKVRATASDGVQEERSLWVKEAFVPAGRREERELDLTSFRSAGLELHSRSGTEDGCVFAVTLDSLCGQRAALTISTEPEGVKILREGHILGEYRY